MVHEGGINIVNYYNELCKKYKKMAFTLAEILIVISIIGLVAEMTIPVLAQKVDERVAVVKLKKFYTVYSQALQLAQIENGPVDEWGLDNSDAGRREFLDKIIPFLKIQKLCTSDPSEVGCTANFYKTLSGESIDTTSPFAPKILLQDSTAIYQGDIQGAPDCLVMYADNIQNICTNIWVDINGTKKPNAFGVDFFAFFIDKNGNLIPRGVDAINPTEQFQSEYDDFNTSCNKTANTMSAACTAWVLYNENMDYLRCNDLSWAGKKTCY